MPSFHRQSQPQTTDKYVSELTRQLRRHLPADKAETIAEETQAHLSDRVEDLTQAGLTRSQAEATAVSGFGGVKRYARAAVTSAYGGRGASCWRLIGRVAAANLLAFFVSLLLLPRVITSGYYTLPMLYALCSCLALIPLAALCTRLPQTRAYLAYHAVALCALFLGAGVLHVPNADTPAVIIGIPQHGTPGPGYLRQDYTGRIQNEREIRQMHRDELTRLERGLAAYRANAPLAAHWKHGGRFVVPRQPFEGVGSASFYDPLGTSAFKDTWLFRRTGDEIAQRHLDRHPYHAVTDKQSAARLWELRAPRWLREKRLRIANSTREINRMQHVKGAPWGFNLGAATSLTTQLLPLCLVIPALDFLMAHLGRALWIVARNFRNRRRGRVA